MVGSLLLKLGLFTGVVQIINLALKELGVVNVKENHFKWLNRIIPILLTTALILLSRSFYLPDFNVFYVFSKVALETPVVYRLSALWVGQEGVFLVWAWAISLCSLYYSEKVDFKESFSRRAVLILVVLTSFFIGLAVMMAPFETTITALEKEAIGSGASLEVILQGMEENGFYNPSFGFTKGQGMSSILMSPWMVLHPPIVFFAYALAVVPFGICLVYLLERKGEWERASRQWARLSWICLSLGLIIGSFWAYEELSFGGYWTWDPIETASLIPWVTLTIFLHGSYENKRKGSFGIVAPFVGVLTTILIIYGTFITKSGLIESSHSYGKSVITPFLESAIILSFLVLIAAATRLYFKEKSPKKDWTPLLSTTNAFYLSAILLGLLLIVLLWGITYPLFAKLTADKTVVIGKSFYNAKGYPIILGLVLLSGYCLLLWVFKKSHAFVVSLAVVGISIIGYFTRPTGNSFVDTFVPIAVFASLSALLRLKQEITSSKNRSIIIKNSSGHLLHLGIAILILGVVASASLQSGVDLIYPYPEEINQIKDVGGGFSIKLVNLLVFQDSKGNWIQHANITVLKEDREIGDLTLSLVNDKRFGRLPKVSILRGFSADIYAVYYGISGGHEQGDFILPINVKVNPYVSLVWIGSILAVLSLAVMFVLEPIYKKS
jgi:cytochrome c-type biogenesis protein CcmF